jgi:hypothetical protein
MKKILVVAAALLAGYVFFSSQHVATVSDAPSSISEQRAGTSDAGIANAFSNRESNLQVAGQGIVIKILPDDTSGSRHQRFIVELSSGQTLLVAHNIDVAPRIDSLRVGDAVQFFGEYEWNQKGGVLHWTHRDTRGTHVAGWLRHKGKTYQ